MGSIPGLGSSPGVGNDNPLKYSCLGTPMDRGACWATVHGVAESWTWLSLMNTQRKQQMTKFLLRRNNLPVHSFPAVCHHKPTHGAWDRDHLALGFWGQGLGLGGVSSPQSLGPQRGRLHWLGVVDWQVLETSRGAFAHMSGAWAVGTLTKTTHLSMQLRLPQWGGWVCRGGAPKGGRGEWVSKRLLQRPQASLQPPVGHSVSSPLGVGTRGELSSGGRTIKVTRPELLRRGHDHIHLWKIHSPSAIERETHRKR